MNGIGNLSGNGGQTVPQNEQILCALEAIHNPRTANALRQEASRYLEEVRSTDEAPDHGFNLASAKEQPAVVRHYGLSLIDYAIRHRWTDYTSAQSKQLRDWVVQLGYSADRQDPPYVTNKIAEVWVELAKKSWGVDWLDMDEVLTHLWQGSLAQTMLALTVIEELSEEVFGSDDTLTALRGLELNRACIEIFTPADVLREQFPGREKSSTIPRFESHGWISNLSNGLERCITEQGQDWHTVAAKTLSALRSIVGWAVPRALTAAKLVDQVCACLAVSEMSVQLAAMETLYALYNRSRFYESDFGDIVGPMFRSETINLLKQLYVWLLVDPTDIDDTKYLLLNRFSEMIFNIGRLFGEKPNRLPENSDLTGFIDLLLSVMKNDSLQVSIPALHLWVKLLSSNSERISKSPAVLAHIGELLETCSHRLIRYEALPVDSSNPSILFLNEDIETVPERHAFLGNYARFCNQVIENVVRQQSIDALYHILGRADQVLGHVYDGEPPFHASTYTKNSVPFLKIDAQFTVIEAALKGSLTWLTSAATSVAQREREVMTSNLQVWCNRLLGLTFEDPQIKERVIQLAVGFSIGPLKRDPQFAVRVFDYTLETRCPDYPDYVAYSEAVRDLQVFAVHQAQRLAMRFADHLVTIFEQVERKVMKISQEVATDEQSRTRYSAVLFVIMHRATSVDSAPREARLEQLVQPLVAQWQDPRLTHALSSFDNFISLIGLGNLRQYMSSRNLENIENWSSQPLDEEGRLIQTQMLEALDMIPLRATKQIMTVSVDKLVKDSQPCQMACRLWYKNFPAILPNLLQFISQAHTLHDPTKWTGINPEMHDIVHRIFTDRFWQVGISQGSRDDFYARVGGTKETLEGFASSIRATVRTIRETGYRLLYCMSILKEHFYSFPDLPGPLSRALFTDVCALSLHQISVLVETMRPLIERCPKESRAHFLPPIVAALFEQVDRKASAEWERIEERNRAAAEDEELVNEMKDESVLRQLTMAAVTLVGGLLQSTTEVGHTDTEPPDTIRSFILQSPEILKPLILFCTHALRMRDTRSCALITKNLRSLVEEFTGSTPVETDVREFISTEVLKACITSLNDPYFVDLQRDFASLIASILTCYTPRTQTPRHVLLSLPGISPDGVDRAVRHLIKAQSSSRQQRVIVLDLLQEFRGVAIHEQGKLPRPDPKKVQSAMQKRYLTADMETMEDKREPSPDLGGVAEMFG